MPIWLGNQQKIIEASSQIRESLLNKVSKRGLEFLLFWRVCIEDIESVKIEYRQLPTDSIWSKARSIAFNSPVMIDDWSGKQHVIESNCATAAAATRPASLERPCIFFDN